jgi:hypothetical protein
LRNRARPRRRRLRRQPFLVRWRRELAANWADHLVLAAVRTVAVLLPLAASVAHQVR